MSGDVQSQSPFSEKEIAIHPRVFSRHQELNEEDVKTAWRSSFAMKLRFEDSGIKLVAIGFDSHKRIVEMVAEIRVDCYYIYHAMIPPSKKTLYELGYGRGSRWRHGNLKKH